MNKSTEREPSLAGVYITLVTASLMLLTGMLLLVYGTLGLIGGIGRSTEEPLYISRLTWCVLHVAGGSILLMAGINLFTGHLWARAIGIAVAFTVTVLSLVALEAYGFWAGVLIFVNIGIIWALAWHGADHTA
jgi:hypothetical protein